MFGSKYRVVAPRIIQNERSVWPFWLAALVVTALVIGWLSFDYGRTQAGDYQLHYEQQLLEAQKEISRLNERLEGLRLESASFERAAQIDKKAVEMSRKDLMQLQQEKAELKREVDLLNGLLSDKTLQAMLELEKFTVTRQEQAGRFAVAFTLVHLTKVGGKVEGIADVQISGKDSGKPVTLKLKDIAVEKDMELKLGFKNFQKLQLDVKLPESFSPENVTITTKTDSKTLKDFKATVKWEPT